MALSKKEKERIDKIEDAVEKETPVEDLELERRMRKSGKLDEKGCPRMMGDMIPLEKRRPGLAEKIVSSTQPLWGSALMGVLISPFGLGKRKPKKDDDSSEKKPKPRPEKKKSDGDDGDGE